MYGKLNKLKLNRLALENLGSQPVVSKLLPQQKIQPNRKSKAMNNEKLRQLQMNLLSLKNNRFQSTPLEISFHHCLRMWD